MTTKEIGDFGEKAAEDYLVEMDYLILERNSAKLILSPQRTADLFLWK